MQDLLNILGLQQLGQHILGSHRHVTLNDCQACGPQSPKGNQNKSIQHGELTLFGSLELLATFLVCVWTMFTVTCWTCDVFGLKAVHRFPT